MELGGIFDFLRNLVFCSQVTKVRAICSNNPNNPNDPKLCLIKGIPFEDNETCFLYKGVSYLRVLTV